MKPTTEDYVEAGLLPHEIELLQAPLRVVNANKKSAHAAAVSDKYTSFVYEQNRLHRGEDTSNSDS